MGFIKDTFFGGAEDEAARQQQRALEGGQDFIREGVEQARGEAIPLFQSAQQVGQQGFQGALDVFDQTVPQQLQAFQGGNVNAQNTLLAGLPQAQAAILGQQLNPNALQAQQQQLPDFSTFQRQLPQFGDINQALGINQPVEQPVQPIPGGGPFGPGGRFGGGGQFGGNPFNGGGTDLGGVDRFGSNRFSFRIPNF